MELKEFVLDALRRHQKAALLVCGSGLVLVGLGLGYTYTRRPEELVRVGVVSQLLIHPLKSGRAVSVAVAEVQHRGLKCGELRDRHWMVVSEDGHMVTGRQQPRLVLVSLTCEDGHVLLNGPNMEELRIPLKQTDGHVLDCRVFGDDVQGRDCGDAASRWLGRYLGEDTTFRLVTFDPHMKARKPQETGTLLPPQEVAYPDFGPVMLLSESSVQDVSLRLQRDVRVEQFRPNVVLTDCQAFSEDSWDELQIGSVRLHRIMSCGRCIFSTVDPETGIIDRREPLETLKSYRLCKPSERHIYKWSPLFGQLHGVKTPGVLKVGDLVYKVTR